MSDYMKIPVLDAKGKKEQQDPFVLLEKLLNGTGESGCINIRILDGNGELHDHIIRFGDRKPHGPIDLILPQEEIDLEITVSEKNGDALLQGTISPLTLFEDGHMGVRGDFHFGIRLLKAIGTGGTEFTICREE